MGDKSIAMLCKTSLKKRPLSVVLLKTTVTVTREVIYTVFFFFFLFSAQAPNPSNVRSATLLPPSWGTPGTT